MPVRGVHHVGIAVDDLDAAVIVYEQLFGATFENRETLESQGVEAASLHVGSGRIELLRPLGPDTPVGRFIAKRGPGMHHVAFEVDDVAEELGRLRAEGAQFDRRAAAAGHVRPPGRIRPSRGDRRRSGRVRE